MGQTHAPQHNEPTPAPPEVSKRLLWLRMPGVFFNRRAQRAWLVGALCLASVGTTVIVIALLLSREKPTWWATIDPSDPQVMELAERVERAVVGAMHRNRSTGEPWTISVSAVQANAWLNAKLPKWVNSRNARWPEQLGQVQAHFENDRISLGVRIGSQRDEQIVAATVRPDLRADGALWLTQPSTNAGRLDLPSGWTLARLAGWLPPEIRSRELAHVILDALRQKGPALATTAITLEDGRRVRLVGVRIENDRLLLTCVTDLPHAGAARGAH